MLCVLGFGVKIFKKKQIILKVFKTKSKEKTRNHEISYEVHHL